MRHNIPPACLVLVATTSVWRPPSDLYHVACSQYKLIPSLLCYWDLPNLNHWVPYLPWHESSISTPYFKPEQYLQLFNRLWLCLGWGFCEKASCIDCALDSSIPRWRKKLEWSNNWEVSQKAASATCHLSQTKFGPSRHALPLFISQT